MLTKSLIKYKLSSKQYNTRQCLEFLITTHQKTKWYHDSLVGHIISIYPSNNVNIIFADIFPLAISGAWLTNVVKKINKKTWEYSYPHLTFLFKSKE